MRFKKGYYNSDNNLFKFCLSLKTFRCIFLEYSEKKRFFYLNKSKLKIKKKSETKDSIKRT